MGIDRVSMEDVPFFISVENTHALPVCSSDEPDIYEVELKTFYVVALYVHGESTHDYLIEEVENIIEGCEELNQDTAN